MDLSCESQEVNFSIHGEGRGFCIHQEVNRFGYAARCQEHQHFCIGIEWNGLDNNLSKSDPGTDFCQGNVRPQAGLLNPDPSSPRPRKVLEPWVCSVDPWACGLPCRKLAWLWFFPNYYLIPTQHSCTCNIWEILHDNLGTDCREVFVEAHAGQ